MCRAPTQSHPTSAAAVQRLMLNLSAVSRLSLSVVLPEKEAQRQASYLLFFHTETSAKCLWIYIHMNMPSLWLMLTNPGTALQSYKGFSGLVTEYTVHKSALEYTYETSVINLSFKKKAVIHNYLKY